LFIEEINNEDIEIKVDACHKLPIVASICGPEVIRNKILPVLGELATSDEDELLYAIAVELGNLRDYIGGPVHFDKLLQILEKLSHETETVVREEALKSIKLISENMNPQHIKTSLLPMLNSLIVTQNFQGKMSSTFLFAIVYPHTSREEKEHLRAKIVELCSDETPLVKKAMTKNLQDCIEVMEKEFILKDLIPVINSLSKDDSDQIRTIILDTLITIANRFSKEENNKYLVNILAEQ